MNSKTNAVVLIALGIVVLEYSYITFVSNLIGSLLLGVVVLASSGPSVESLGKPLDLLGMQFEIRHSYLIPAVVGALALIGGSVLLVTARIRGLTNGAVFQPSHATVNPPPNP